MPSLEPILDRFIPYLLVTFRLAGIFILAPLLSSIMVPMRIKGLFVLMLGAAIFPFVPEHARSVAALPAIDLATLLPMVVRETLIGLSIGAIAVVPLLSMEAAGVLIGYQVGFGLAKVYNPELDADADLIGQLLFYLAVATFLAIGGLEMLFLGAADSLKHIPIGGMGAQQVPLDTLIGVVSVGCELAMRIAAPIVGIVILLLAVFGFLTKTMPQINVMSVGFAVKIIAGLAILALSLGSAHVAIGDEISRVLHLVASWSRG